MYFTKISFLLLCLSTTGVLLSEVSDAFNDANIIADTNIKAPNHFLQLVYGDADNITLGNELNAGQIALPPQFCFVGNPHFYYTLIMIDLDGPRIDQLTGQFLEWMISNIKGADIDSGETTFIYRPPLPLPCDIRHRYVFLLYEHKHKLVLDLKDIVVAAASAGPLPIIHIDEYAKRNKLGDPKFGNYFTAVTDKSVAALCKDVGVNYDTNTFPFG